MSVYLHQNDLADDLIISGDIAIDTETMGLNNARDRLCVLQLSNGDGSAHLVQFQPDNFAAPNLKKLLSNKESTKILHFARFDIAVIKKYLGIELENIFCTKIASRLARTYTDAHGLKELCKELLDIQLSKQQQSSDWGAKELSKEQLKYAASDVIYLHRIRAKLMNMLEREGRTEIANQCFLFLNHRTNLDLLGWQDIDIFAH